MNNNSETKRTSRILKQYILEVEKEVNTETSRLRPQRETTPQALRKGCKQLIERGFDAENFENFELAADFLARWHEDVLEKGIFLCGNVGTGKSYFAKIFYDTSDFNDVRFYTAKELVDRYKDGMARERWYELCGFGHDRKWKSCLIIDDLGSEQQMVNYGERTELLGDLISLRYDMSLRNPRMRTFITSNFGIDEIEKGLGSRSGYGERISSRIKQLCDVKVFQGADRRRPQK